MQVNIGNLQQGQVVALYNYMAQIIVELIKLASLIITLNKSMACADRVSGILDVKSSMEYKVAAEQMKNEQINVDQRKYGTDGENEQADSNLAVEFNHSPSHTKVPEHPAYRTSPSVRRKDRRSESSEEPEVVRVHWSA